jgi:hypothetical protein
MIISIIFYFQKEIIFLFTIIIITFIVLNENSYEVRQTSALEPSNKPSLTGQLCISTTSADFLIAICHHKQTPPSYQQFALGVHSYFDFAMSPPAKSRLSGAC